MAIPTFANLPDGLNPMALFDQAFANMVRTDAFQSLTTAQKKQVLSNISSPATSVMLYGAKADGITDDTAAITAAIAATPSGGTLLFPPSYCLVSGSGSAIFTITKPIYIVGSGMDSGGILVSSTVPSTTDLFHFVPALGGMRGVSIQDIAIQPQSGSPGRHLIHVDTTSANNIFAAEFQIRRTWLYDTTHGNSVFFNNTSSGLGVFNSVIAECLITGPVNLLWVGDSIRFTGNIISTYVAGTGNPITISQLGGAGNVIIENCNITGGGGTVITGATGIIISHNEFEQITTNTEANNAIIDITGSSTQVVRPLIIGNQIQANASTGAPNLIRVGNAVGCVVDQNYLGSGDGAVAVINTASASGTVMGPNNTYVGTSANITDSGTGTIYPVLPLAANKINVLANGKIGLGAETNPQTTLVVSANVTTGLTPPVGNGIYLISADGVAVSTTIDSYGTASGGPNVVGRYARNTAASPQAVQAGDQLGFYQGLGHDGSAFNINEAAGFRVEAAETWTTSHYGSRLTFYCTPSGTTSRAEAARVNGSGSLSVGTTTDPGAGAIVANKSITLQNATAVPAGGTQDVGLLMSSTAHLGVFFGSGAPTLSAAQGSLYLRTDGSSTSTRLYVNTNGSTTWTNVTTAA